MKRRLPFDPLWVCRRALPTLQLDPRLIQRVQAAQRADLRPIPLRLKRNAFVGNPPAKPTNTVPTGLSSVSPSGPATPVTDRLKSVQETRLAPSINEMKRRFTRRRFSIRYRELLCISIRS